MSEFKDGSFATPDAENYELTVKSNRRERLRRLPGAIGRAAVSAVAFGALVSMSFGDHCEQGDFEGNDTVMAACEVNEPVAAGANKVFDAVGGVVRPFVEGAGWAINEIVDWAASHNQA